jgi:hypothetical protein
VASSRIQVYDREGKFLRGWSVPASGGAFKLHVTKDDNLEVFTARGDRRLVFAADGTLLVEGQYRGEDYDRLPTGPDCQFNHTAAWYLLPLAHPFLAMLPGVAGFVGIVFLFHINNARRFSDGLAVSTTIKPSNVPRRSVVDTPPERVKPTEEIVAGIIVCAAGLMVVMEGIWSAHDVELAMIGALMLIGGLILLTVGWISLRRTYR